MAHVANDTFEAEEPAADFDFVDRALPLTDSVVWCVLLDSPHSSCDQQHLSNRIHPLKKTLSILPLCLALSATFYLGACSDSGDSATSTSESSDGSAADSSSSAESESDVLTSTDVDTDVCASESANDLETLVCAANDFLETLSESEQSTVLLDWSDSEAKTT